MEAGREGEREGKREGGRDGGREGVTCNVTNCEQALYSSPDRWRKGKLHKRLHFRYLHICEPGIELKTVIVSRLQVEDKNLDSFPFPFQWKHGIRFSTVVEYQHLYILDAK